MLLLLAPKLLFPFAETVTIAVAAETCIIAEVAEACVIIPVIKAIVGIVVITKTCIVTTEATSIRNVIVVGSAGVKKFTVRTGAVWVIAAYFLLFPSLVFLTVLVCCHSPQNFQSHHYHFAVVVQNLCFVVG